MLSTSLQPHCRGDRVSAEQALAKPGYRADVITVIGRDSNIYEVRVPRPYRLD